MAVKAIVFDFFGVICSDVADIWYKNNHPAITYEELKQRYLGSLDKGIVPAEETWRALAALVKVPVEQLKSDWQTPAKLNPKMVDLIRGLKERYAVAICTNADAEFFHSIMDDENFRNLFSTIVISSEEKVAKPDPAIFQILLQKLALEPEEVLFIDDSPHNVAAVEALGIQGIRFTSVDELKKTLFNMAVETNT